jgi:hypothetical protein
VGPSARTMDPAQTPVSHANTTGVGLVVPKPTRDAIYYHSYYR